MICLTRSLWLIKHPEECEKMSIAAYNTMKDVWSPQNAANQLIDLVRLF